MTPEAVEAESTGYFVLPQSTLPTGWRMASAQEQQQVHGRGRTEQGTSKATSSEDAKAKPDECSAGCPKYNVHSMLVSLNIEDTPVAYRPAFGPMVAFRVTYNQRDDLRPITPNFGNLGPKWTHNWQSYIEDDPTNLVASVLRFLPGGGSRDETGYNTTTRQFAPSLTDKAVLRRISDNPVRYELAHRDGSKWLYGYTDGRVTKPRRVFLTGMADAHGNQVTLAYDGQNRLTTITDAAGAVSRLSYDLPQAPFLITKVINPAGQSASFVYNANGRLDSITDAVGMVSSFEYGSPLSADFIRRMVTPYGPTVFEFGEQTTVDGVRRWLVATDPLGHQERFEFRHDAPGVATTDTAPAPGFVNNYMNRRNAYYWDKQVHALHGAVGAGLPDYTKADVSHFLHTNTAPSTTSQVLESTVKYPDRRTWFKYPGQSADRTIFEGTSHQPIEITRMLPDGSPQTHKRTYNAQGNVTGFTDPVGRQVTLTYASNGIDVRSISRKTSATATATLATYTYNAQHQPLTQTDAAGQVTTYAYNARGQVTSITNPLNQVVRFQHDASGRLITIENALGRTAWTFVHDDAGNVVEQADSEGRSVSHAYDALNRRIQSSYPDGTSESWTYDKLDVSAYTNRAGVTTRYTHNANREQIRMDEPVDEFTQRSHQYAYHPNGHIKTLKDPNGNVTTWERDLKGRVTRKLYADGKGYTQTHDVLGRLSTRKDALNQVVTWSYAKDDVLASVKVAGALQTTPDTTWVWDAYHPRVRQMVDGTGTTTYDYVAPGVNGALQLKCDSGAWANTAICYTHDALGRVVSRSVQAADASDTSSWVYDELGRVKQEALGRLGVFDLTYLGDTGQVVQRVGPGGLMSAFQYENDVGDRRLKRITHPLPRGMSAPVAGGEPATSYDYQTNSLGQITRVLSMVGAVPRGVVEQFFEYDSADRLTAKSEASLVPVPSAPAKTQYRRDLGDNLLQVAAGTSDPNPGVEPAASFQVNALNQVTAQDGRLRTHDANGNLLRDARSTYAWDGLDRLVRRSEITSPATSSWRYDGENRRAELTEGGVVRRYRWCGQDVCAVLDGASRVQSWVHAGRGEVNAGRRLVYAEDHLGSVRQVYDGATGHWLLGLEYDSHGRLKEVKCATASDCQRPHNGGLSLGYAGLYWHGASGLYLATYRAYDPRAMRWLSRDPIEEAGGVNLYGYVGGNPQSYTDSLGLAVSCKTVLHLGLAKVQVCEDDGKSPGEQSAKDAKRMSDKELDKACKNNGYRDAHDMKRDFGYGSDTDIFSDKDGNMYAGPRKGSGTPQYIHMNASGVVPRP